MGLLKLKFCLIIFFLYKPTRQEKKIKYVLCYFWAPGPLKIGFSTYFHPEFNPQNSKFSILELVWGGFSIPSTVYIIVHVRVRINIYIEVSRASLNWKKKQKTGKDRTIIEKNGPKTNRTTQKIRIQIGK